MTKISAILQQDRKPALFIGNGINQFKNNQDSSWQDLLGILAGELGVNLSREQRKEMSSTEFFDILDLARPREDRRKLQSKFCDLMKHWKPSAHHRKIVSWARQHQAPIITANFDENLSRAVNAEYQIGEGFTDWYPWSSYFSDDKIDDPRTSFAIWHAHGMMRYARSIRLGLRDYMGAVHHARSWLYRGATPLVRTARENGEVHWKGQNTWLEIVFFCPIVILGFGFEKNESFLRWLFLERARIHKINPYWKTEAWFVDTQRSGNLKRKPFFEHLGMKYVTVDNYDEIYEDASWQS